MSDPNPAPIVFTPDRAGWERLFAVIDRRDAETFARYLTPAGEFRFGNAPPVRGRDAVRQTVASFFDLIAGCRHRLLQCWSSPPHAVCEGEVTYELTSGATVTVPFVNVFQLHNELIASYRIYIDNAPLFTALNAA